MKPKFLTLIFLVAGFISNAQTDVDLTIQHMLGSSPFAFNQATSNDLGNNLEFTRVDYYISQISLIHDGGTETAVPNKYIYVRASSNVIESLGSFNITSLEGIKFHIGVEAPTNTSDPAAFTGNHPLAPKSPSMHWGWASGYRFVAVEGNAGASLSNLFQFHGLFDDNYFEQTVMTSGVATTDKLTINLDADYNEALRGIDVSSGAIEHGVNRDDLVVLQNFRDHVFSEGTGLPQSVKDVASDIDVNIFPNPSAGDFHISITELSNYSVTDLYIYDMMGRQVTQVDMKNSLEADVNIGTSGLYFIKMNDGENTLATKAIVIQ